MEYFKNIILLPIIHLNFRYIERFTHAIGKFQLTSEFRLLLSGTILVDKHKIFYTIVFNDNTRFRKKYPDVFELHSMEKYSNCLDSDFGYFF